jgi:hypothetical protein
MEQKVKRKYVRKKPYVRKIKPVDRQFDTKLKVLLFDRQITQVELQELILSKTGKQWGRDRICNYVNGNISTMTTKSALIIAQALGVNVSDIIDD